MPYQLSWKPNCVVFEYSGIVTSEDILESNRDVYSDDRFDQLRYQVVLFDYVDEVKYQTKDVRHIAYLDMAAFRSNPNIVVLFVGDSSLLRELNTLYESFVEGRGWPSFQLEDREHVWTQIEEMNASRGT